MPPLRGSRHLFAEGRYDIDDALFVADRAPFAYRKISDSWRHLVMDGDALWSLAAKYYAEFPRPAGLWWVIGDFQQPPIVDPTIALPSGSIVWVPSCRTVRERIFDPARSRIDVANVG